MRNLHFKDFFWNVELISTGGYDTIIHYLNDGKRTCKEIEEFIKARASIEEKYAKDLLSLSKKVCGHAEMNALKKSLDVFKLQTEHVSLAHLQLAQSMRGEVKKLEEFREKQKEMKKKMEQNMDAFHKLKSSQFKKTMEAKKMYEHKCRDKEEADQNVNRNANTSNSKQIDKLCTKALQATQNAEEADRSYQQNINTLAKAREDWIREHVSSCEVFENLAKERIVFLRNAVWTHLNQLSQQCVTNDELYEEVRKSLECCDVQRDIEHFINLRKTGEKPPAPVLYESFYTTQRSPTPQPPQPSRRTLALPNQRNSPEEPVYSSVPDDGYSVIQF
ncbi:proline-serine-threonine phosphatase-interacting protein 2 isoform X3 [Takifugu flavidus]|uniref:Proline-serine-threonine phosphatase-interacting protein 2 n=1 Tax=Takifugu flavidus TaxID=433684 RepID=A0A5C6NHI0_9TELE|nr:proline-serine-threonine phosphatase-interacting protein 2 isoform X3 [Takifugu flavidus]TWW66435.1 Proline-serine-threonine phosphatase-interacting protein 2 [Takifugu flavidus]